MKSKFEVGDIVMQVEEGWGTGESDNGKTAMIVGVSGGQIAINDQHFDYEREYRDARGFKLIKKRNNMMRVRVLREMPFAKVGELLEIEDGIESKGFRSGFTSIFNPLNCLIKDGWLEEVKEESLDEILHSHLYRYSGTSGCLFARDHIRQHFIDAVKKIENPYDEGSKKDFGFAIGIRSAIEAIENA